jgi:D-glycero-D-manno-heptose 1,7-bisphosphate phosphatase
MGVPVAIVTNQSGIARGHFGWDGFHEVQRAIDLAISKAGGWVDGVFACAYHGSGEGTLAVPDHPWRKPRPGMLNLALDIFNGQRARSAMIGDKTSDMEAAAAANIQFKFLISADVSCTASGYSGIVSYANPAEAISAFLTELRRAQVQPPPGDGAFPAY